MAAAEAPLWGYWRQQLRAELRCADPVHGAGSGTARPLEDASDGTGSGKLLWPRGFEQELKPEAI